MQVFVFVVFILDRAGLDNKGVTVGCLKVCNHSI